jgi:DNA-binding NarL/FixJ family response regulator
MFTDALRLLLEMEGGVEAAEIASTGEQAVEMCRRKRPQVVLMDVRLPGMDGLEATRRIREACPETQVVVITGLGDQDLLAGSVKAGACGLVTKTEPVRELVAVIRRAAAGEMVLSTRELQRALQGLREVRGEPGHVDRMTEQLTSREVDILQAFVDGRSRPEVAETLFLSIRTVDSHIGSILRKLGCRSLMESVLRALRMGIIRLPNAR